MFIARVHGCIRLFVFKVLRGNGFDWCKEKIVCFVKNYLQLSDFQVSADFPGTKM